MYGNHVDANCAAPSAQRRGGVETTNASGYNGARTPMHAVTTTMTTTPRPTRVVAPTEATQAERVQLPTASNVTTRTAIGATTLGQPSMTSGAPSVKTATAVSADSKSVNSHVSRSKNSVEGGPRAQTDVTDYELVDRQQRNNINKNQTQQLQLTTNRSEQKAQQLQQHQQQQQQQLHQQKSKLSPSNVGAGAGGGVGVVAGLQQHQQQQHYQNNNGTSPSNGSSHRAPSTATATTTTTLTATSSVSIPVETVPPMRTIELSTGRIREGFANGDVIVTLLPANTKWPWITPAIFRPELVPEELMAQGLTLTVEEYVNAMETLVNDYRFTVYNICYKRILVCWIALAFTVLLTLLFSGLQGVALFSLGVGWLFLNAAAIFLCMWVKLRLSRGLEKCLARVNRQLMKHKILLILDDRGRISCHKVNLCFLYFDATQCVNFLNEFLEHTEQSGGEAIKAGWERKLDIDVNDIVIQGNNPVRLSRKQVVAQELFLSYLQRWGKDFLRRRLDWTVQEAGVHETPRHLQSSICPCQYEEELLRNKIKIQLKGKQCCGVNCIGCWL
uniref:Transmembrane protein C9orf91 n=1 Tax=Ceratitis capitata TaxID=7213 RepID=W8AJ33_CERCA